MWSDSIQDDLPTQHPDEPPHLRDDITDELNDHLANAMRRELLKDHDEPAAVKRVLAHFGNPARIARQLYLAAMKEQLMKDRITIGLMTAIALFCAVTLLLVWNMTRRTDAMQQQFVMAVGNMQSSLAELDRYAMEWGSLTIELTDAQGRPVSGQRFHIDGNMYGVGKVTKIETTDAAGRIVLKPIRAGTNYDVFTVDDSGDSMSEGWHYSNLDWLLDPGEDKVLRLRQPEASQLVPVTFEIDWPQAWTANDIWLSYSVGPKSIELAGRYESWTHANLELWFKRGTPEQPDADREHRIPVSGDRFMLPTGTLDVSSIRILQMPPSSRTVDQIEYNRELNGDDSAFEVRPGNTGPVRIPIPREVQDAIEHRLSRASAAQP